VVEPVIARYRGTVKRRYFRGDAAFADPEIYEFLEAEGMGYATRMPANRVVQDKIGYLLKRTVERPTHEVRRCIRLPLVLRVGGRDLLAEDLKDFGVVPMTAQLGPRFPTPPVFPALRLLSAPHPSLRS
jgi:hypothetical protein